MMRTTPLRLMTLHLGQIGLTDALTFMTYFLMRFAAEPARACAALLTLASAGQGYRDGFVRLGRARRSMLVDTI